MDLSRYTRRSIIDGYTSMITMPGKPWEQRRRDYFCLDDMGAFMEEGALVVGLKD